MEKTDERGVSPVIGIILMIAVTVILATVLGSFSLSFATQFFKNAKPPQAGFAIDETYDESTDEYTVTVTAVSMSNADKIRVEGPSVTTSLEKTGDYTTLSSLEKGDRIVVVAVRGKSSQVMTSYVVGS